MRKIVKIGIAGTLGLAAMGAVAIAQGFPPAKIVAMPAAEAAKLDAWSFRLTAIDGEPMPMSKYKGKVVLLVNTATQCGFRKQLDAPDRAGRLRQARPTCRRRALGRLARAGAGRQ